MDDSNQTSKIDRFESTEDILRAVSRIIDQNDDASSAPPSASQPPPVETAPPPPPPAAPAPPATPAPPAAPSTPAAPVVAKPAEPPSPSPPARSLTRKKFSASPQAAVFRGGKTDTPPNQLFSSVKADTPPSEPSSEVKADTPSEFPTEKILSPPVMKKAEEPPPQEDVAVFKKPATKESVKELPAAPQNTITETTPCLELTDMIDDNGTIISLPLIGTADSGGVSHEASVKESVMNQLKGKISHIFTKEEKIDDVIELKAKEWLEAHMPQLVEQAVDQALKKKTNHDNASKEF